MRKLSLKRIVATRPVQKAIGVLAAEYLRFVYNTSRQVNEPADIYERVARDAPVILAMWHGQHFMAPFMKRKEHRAKTLISRHRDGEINAIAAERLGVETIRGSGDHGGEFHRKGGISAYKEMLQALADGYHVALTADIPKVARVAGLGIVRLARDSGRPIYPVAITTSRRFELDNWDRSTINLPFSRLVGAIADPIWIAPEAGQEELEKARRAVEMALNKGSARAIEIADGPGERFVRG